MQIKDNVFIVTGGASGLGGGTTRLLAANGAKVVIADVQADKGEALARELGANARFVKCDVASEADAQGAVAAAQQFGTLRGLVNCAGIAIGEKTVGKDGPHALASFTR
ncbi:MAG: SDR family NAD(P)-dependent oxidoreductase, partial [Burkholderiaceae bacterium]